MWEMVKMVLVLSILSLFSGGVLAYLNDTYKENIEINELDFVKGPALKSIFKESCSSF